MSPLLCTLLDHLLQSLCREGLWPLYGQPQGPVPDEGGEHAQSTGHAKQHCVEPHLVHAVVLRGLGGGAIYQYSCVYNTIQCLASALAQADYSSGLVQWFLQR